MILLGVFVCTKKLIDLKNCKKYIYHVNFKLFMTGNLINHFYNSKYYSLKYKNYFPIYETLFSRFIDKEIVFVEIGVLSGGSLFMWRRFFGNKARIIGIDLNNEAKKFEKYGFEIGRAHV